MKDLTERLFIYGMLRISWLRTLICLRRVSTRKTILKGYKKEGLNITETVGEETEGEIISITPQELRRIDLFEWRYERQHILVEGEPSWVYVRK